ncbi:MAG TPA: cytochrome b N-terminal domain-containing protein [Gemmatimonadaceae bacterium]
MKRLWRQLGAWLDDRLGLTEQLRPLIKHKVPPDTGWGYVFGSATLAAFLLQVVTGAALATMYVPSAGSAYQSLQYISHDALWGSVLRGMHYFGASAMIVLLGMHAIRVFITGSYKFPREVNWISGVLLLGLTVTMGFTGQVLRWDQDGLWSAVVAAEQAGRVPVIGHLIAQVILGGDHLGTATLSHLFAYHVFLIPALIAGVIGLHLYLVIHHGISEPPVAGAPVDPATYRARYQQRLNDHGVPFWPDAAWRDVVFVCAVMVLVVGLAVVVGPKPLGKPPDPSIIQAEPRPDWYLLWLFAVLAELPHGAEQYLMWLLPLAAAAMLLMLPLVFGRGERHLRRRPWAAVVVTAIVVGVAVFWQLGVVAPWSPDFSAPLLPPSVVASSDSIVMRGAQLFHERGCENCHTVSGYGGIRGPDLTTAGDRLSGAEIVQWIENGGINMPAFSRVLNSDQLDALRAFLSSRHVGTSR